MPRAANLTSMPLAQLALACCPSECPSPVPQGKRTQLMHTAEPLIVSRSQMWAACWTAGCLWSICNVPDFTGL